MDLLTLGLVGAGAYLFLKNKGTSFPEVVDEIGNLGDDVVIPPPVTPPTPPVTTAPPYTPVPQTFVPTYGISYQEVQQALAQQDGTIETGWIAQTAVAQQMADAAAQKMVDIGLTKEDMDTFSQYIDKRNPATGSYYTYDDLIALHGWTEAEINVMREYIQSRHLASMAMP